MRLILEIEDDVFRTYPINDGTKCQGGIALHTHDPQAPVLRLSRRAMEQLMRDYLALNAEHYPTLESITQERHP